jgi:IS30 family transposase
MACHLTKEEREVVSNMCAAGSSQAQIARRLGRADSTISREIGRNGGPGGYSAVAAQQKAEARRRERPLVRKMDRPEIAGAVRRGLAQSWSPDQIAGRMRVEGAEPRQRVSRMTIYRWIDRLSDKNGTYWRRFLRFGRRRPPDSRGKIPRPVHIADRPAVADRRERYGDWEGDTVVGSARSGAIVTLVERKSGFVLTRKVLDRTAQRVRRAIARAFAHVPPELRRTLTLDNGKEFSQHEQLSRSLGLNVYFAKPYCAWQRGTNENTNGLLRQHLPKGTDFRTISHHELAHLTERLNTRPRKRLGYQTPNEVFQILFG